MAKFVVEITAKEYAIILKHSLKTREPLHAILKRIVSESISNLKPKRVKVNKYKKDSQ